MVRLQILDGQKSGCCFSGSNLPLRVGRAANSEFVLDEPGVWPVHFSIQRDKNDLVIHAGPDALLRVNDEPVQSRPLRNGDVINVGAIRLRFGFGPLRQRSLEFREYLTWGALACLAAGEIAVAYSLW